jgi:hypothetical protein
MLKRECKAIRKQRGNSRSLGCFLVNSSDLSYETDQCRETCNRRLQIVILFKVCYFVSKE